MNWLNIFNKKNLQKATDFYIFQTDYNQQTGELLLVGQKNDRPWVSCYDIFNDKIIFQKYISNKNGAITNCFKIKTDENYYLLTGKTSNKSIIVKISKQGEILWKLPYDDMIIRSAVIEDDKFILIGNRYEKPPILLTITKNGEIVQQTILNTQGTICSIHKIYDKYILIGNKENKIWITEITKTENTWKIQTETEKLIGKDNYIYKPTNSICTGNHIIIVGHLEKTHKHDLELKKGFIIKTNFDGTIIWGKIILEISIFTKVIEADGGYVATGFKKLGYNIKHPILCKFNPSGNLEWIKKYHIEDYVIPYDIEYVATTDLGYLITGIIKFNYTFEEQEEEYESWFYRPFILKTTKQGDALTYTIKPNIIDFEFEKDKTTELQKGDLENIKLLI